MKYVTTTLIRGMNGPGHKIPAGTLVELDEKKPEHARLIEGGDVVLYVEPKKPEEVKLAK